MAISSQKLVSRILSRYKSLHCFVFQSPSAILKPDVKKKSGAEKTNEASSDLFDAHDFDIKLDLQMPPAGRNVRHGFRNIIFYHCIAGAELCTHLSISLYHVAN